MKSDKDIIDQFQKHYNITKGGLKNQYREIEECRAFYNGDYMNYKDNVLYGRGSSRRLREVSFNRVKPYVNAFVGFFVQNRRMAHFMAKNMDPQKRQAETDYINGFYQYCRENSHAEQVETQQDFDMAIGGVGVTDTAITIKDGTPSRLPGGEIIKERVDPLECGWDPNDKSPNLIDSKWVWRAKDYDKEEAIELFDSPESDFEVVSPDDNIRDYEFNPYGGIQDKIGFEYADPQRSMLRVYFYQWYEVEDFYRVPNPLLKRYDPRLERMLFLALNAVEQDPQDETFAFDPTAQILTVTKQNKKNVLDIFDAFEIPWEAVTEKRKIFFTAILSGKKVFQKFKSVSQQGYSLKFKVGDRDYNSRMWTGIVSSMKQPQRYFNKALTEFMLIIASNAKGGIMAEKGAIGNIQEFEYKYARNNSVVEVDDITKVMPKATPQLNTGYEAVMSLSGEAFQQVTGINETFFGVNASGNETAMLQRQRIKQATTLLATYVDSATLYTKTQAGLDLSFMRMLAESNTGDIFAMNDSNGVMQPMPISQKYLADEYMITISEAPETDTQKDYYATMLINLANQYMTIGDTQKAGGIYALAIKQLPIEEKDKQELNALLEGQQVDPRIVQQLQTQVQQLTSQQAQLQAAKVQSDIQKDQADIAKKYADIESMQYDNRESIEDIEKKSIENDILATQPPTSINVTI